ncbi:IpaD/SipD/SspD family type III secretion system needle tip protein [Cedecea sp. FDAARGOS_727]|uniref:IpaD/SipD/SspD family type III secretion system needle tip protein n=1 Tax=Cedecea sp. FDAARGOS_727 TaxID=2545798 RepID=UPI00143E31BA|nr:IpaD/SipD/SspD family type III secretion system needle tip protein [Cedecea sp. FDAARGOS_727]QIX96599.1 IpaD/SipD/SspD family type III secretion system needle tip protein [Cedecea sp. FDAARGOS_727]
MSISSNYLNSIPNRHAFHSVIDSKDSSSTTSQHVVVQKATQGYKAESAVDRLLNKPFITVIVGKNELIQSLNDNRVDVFIDKLGAIKARTALVSREVSSRMDVLRNSGAPEMKASLPLPADQRSSAGPAIDMSAFLRNLGLLSPDIQLDGAEQDNSLLDSLKSATSGGRSGPSSSWNICESVADAIGNMGEDYLDVFQNAVEKYAAFYTDFTDFMSRLKEFIQEDDDGKIRLNFDKFTSALKSLISQYSSDSATRLYPTDNSKSSREDCEAWCKEMGLDPNKCLRGSGNSYSVNIDTSPLEKILDSVKLNWKGKEGNWMLFDNSAEWAAWQAGTDMQKDTVQTGMQTLTQKYSNANSTFDNLVKVLSSTITSLLDCDKNFLNI